MHKNVTDKNKSIKTIPKGVWESSRPSDKRSKSSKSTDLQGNGYPSNKRGK